MSRIIRRLAPIRTPWEASSQEEASFTLDFDESECILKIRIHASTLTPEISSGDSNDPPAELPDPLDEDYVTQPWWPVVVEITFDFTVAFRVVPFRWAYEGYGGRTDDVCDKYCASHLYERLDKSEFTTCAEEEHRVVPAPSQGRTDYSMMRAYVLCAGESVVEVFAESWKWRYVDPAPPPG